MTAVTGSGPLTSPIRSFVIAVAAMAMLMGTALAAGSAEAQESPFGKTYRLAFNSTAQKAIIGGSAAAAGTIFCILGGETVCATVIPTAVAAGTPVLLDAGQCPNNGTRVVELVNNLAPPRPGEPSGEVITSPTGFTQCIPA